MNEVYRYQFEKGVSFRDVKESLLVAVVAAECLHGESRVRLEANYCVDDERQSFVIDADTPVGRDIGRVFTGLCIKEFGVDSFTVERVSDRRRRATGGPLF